MLLFDVALLMSTMLSFDDGLLMSVCYYLMLACTYLMADNINVPRSFKSHVNNCNVRRGKENELYIKVMVPSRPFASYAFD